MPVIYFMIVVVVSIQIHLKTEEPVAPSCAYVVASLFFFSFSHDLALWYVAAGVTLLIGAFIYFALLSRFYEGQFWWIIMAMGIPVFVIAPLVLVNLLT